MSVLEAPYGSWPSSLRAERVAVGAARLSQPRIDRDLLYWLEARPAEQGRQVLVRAPLRAADGDREDVSPAGVSVRTLVHEYGGGDYTVRDGVVYYVDLSDQRIHRLADGRARPVTPSGARYADLEPSPDGRWLLAVEERHPSVAAQGREPENRLVAVDLGAGRDPGGTAPRPVASGHDFFSHPRFSAAGDRLAYTCWDHPNMPWDGTWMEILHWGASGPEAAAHRVAGGPSESVVQPGFSPAGAPTFISDRSGWWNLYRLAGGPRNEATALCPRQAEFAGPQWVFGLSSYVYESDTRLLCIHAEQGRQQLSRLHLETGELTPLPLPYHSIAGLHRQGHWACFIAASPTQGPTLILLDLRDDSWVERAWADESVPDPDTLARPEPIEFASVEGRRAHAYLYAPTNPAARAPAGERPPLLVKSHGGPTSAASPALDLRIQYWTSRGFAVVDVDYGGSTGYGRAYRELLRGQWGIVDVEDCLGAARSLVDRGAVDGTRLAISGGSAGGYTTLCALTFHDLFAAGASHYGIGDLEALVRDTHKFESRYTDALIGPYPERRDLYVARSPIHATERLRCPVIFFQGLEDRVVPPGQAEAMVAALAQKGIRHAYVPFEGEQHGFRRAENIVTALEGEHYFYARVLGFPPGPQPPGVVIVN